jgi:signal transduction histidine kinase
LTQFVFLTPMLGGPGAPRYPINERPQLIGRSDKVDIPLFEPTVSRQHATIQFKNDEVLLKDLGSKHGTFVNSRRITQTKLKVGDIVVFGLSLVLRLEASDKPVPPPEPLSTITGQYQEFSEAEENDPSVTAIRSMITPKVSSRRSIKPTETFINDLAEDHQQQFDSLRIYQQAAVGVHCLVRLQPMLDQGNALVTGLQDTDRPLDRKQLLSSAQALQEQLQLLAEATAELPKPRLEATSLTDVVQQAMSTITPEVAARHVEIVSDIDPSLWVMVDPLRMTSALVQFLRFACQASPDGSLVEILALRSNRSIVLTISDQGRGFPREILDRLLDPLYTIDSDLETIGLHLNLFLAYHSVMSFGGSIKITSKPNIGSTVRIHLSERLI